ncbi:MAG: hypothetical protein WC551_00945 [Patescibacteria group bacterium]
MGKKNRHKPPGQIEPAQSDSAVKSGEVDQSLSAIFRDESGEMPDLTKLDRRRSRFIIYLFAGIAGFLLLLLAAVWAGFMVFKPFRSFGGNGLELNIDGPSRVALGQETSYFVNYRNTSNEPLAAAEIRVSFPSDFSITKVEPTPTEKGLDWRLGSVEYGGRGTFTIKGVFTGSLGTKTAIQAVGSYRPASFNSDFEALATKQLDYAESVLDGMVSVPEKALPGDKVRIAYTVQNRGSDTMKGLEARMTLPPGFVRETPSTAGQLDENLVKLPLGDIAAGASATVAVVGTFTSGSGGNLPIHAEAGRVSPDGSFQVAQKTDSNISVLAGDLTLKLVANGSDGDRTVSFGDSLRFALGYENTSGETLQNISIHFKLEPLASSSTATGMTGKKASVPGVSRFVDWSELDDSSSGTVAGDVLTWNKDQVGALERLPANQDGSFEFTLPIVAANMTATGTSGFQAVVEATVEMVGDAKLNRTVRTQPMVFRFKTDASLSSEARYFSEEGAPEGSGPLPPVVGQATTYRINWAVAKSLHELKDMRVTASLPANVAWPKNSTVSAGVITYDDTSRKITWELNKMPVDVSEVTAEFDVTLVPTNLDSGRFATLMNETRFEALDTMINETMVLAKPKLTTDLQNDEGAKGKGVVRKP